MWFKLLDNLVFYGTAVVSGFCFVTEHWWTFWVSFVLGIIMCIWHAIRDESP